MKFVGLLFFNFLSQYNIYFTFHLSWDLQQQKEFKMIKTKKTSQTSQFTLESIKKIYKT